MARDRDAHNVGGGTAACWIQTDSADDAVGRARKLLQRAGWRETVLVEVRLISRHEYGPDNQAIQYFDQVEIDGEVCVIHTYPKDDADPQSSEDAAE